MSTKSKKKRKDSFVDPNNGYESTRSRSSLKTKYYSDDESIDGESVGSNSSENSGRKSKRKNKKDKKDKKKKDKKNKKSKKEKNYENAETDTYEYSYKEPEVFPSSLTKSSKTTKNQRDTEQFYTESSTSYSSDPIFNEKQKTEKKSKVIPVTQTSNYSTKANTTSFSPPDYNTDESLSNMSLSKRKNSQIRPLESTNRNLEVPSSPTVTNSSTSSTKVLSSAMFDKEFPTIITTSQPHIVKIVDFPGTIPQILCITADTNINRYSISDGQMIHPPLIGHTDRIISLNVSNSFCTRNASTGQVDISVVAVSGSRDGDIRLWDLVRGQCLNRIAAYGTISPLSGLPFVCWAVSVIVRGNGQIQILSSGGESGSVVTRSQSIRVSAAPGAHRAATSTSSNGRFSRKVLDDVHIWDGLSGQKLHTLSHPLIDELVENNMGETRVVSLLVHQPLAVRSLLFTAGTYPDIFIWDHDSTTLLCILRGHIDSITSLALSSTPMASSFFGKSFFGAVFGGPSRGNTSSSSASATSPMVFDTDEDEIESIVRILDLSLSLTTNASTPSKNATMLVSSSNDKTIRVWNVRKGRTAWVWTQHHCPIQSISVAVSPPGLRGFASGIPLCLSVGDDGVVRVWNIHTGKLIKVETTWHQGLSAVSSLTPTTFFRSIDSVSVSVPITSMMSSIERETEEEQGYRIMPMSGRSIVTQSRVLIATCAWNNSVQCHDLAHDLLGASMQTQSASSCAIM